MCRLSAFFGAPICAADLVTRPSRSIITQSFDARERMSGDASTPGYLNGDGFGLGWYSSDPRDPVPCVYRQARPAWNDGNLGSIAEKVYSPVLFAHVRAASPGMDVSETTCHPFRYGRYLWMHNGGLGGFKRVRRNLLAAFDEDVFDFAMTNGSSDSALCFAVFLSLVPDKMAISSPDEMRLRLEKALIILRDAARDVGSSELSLLNFVVSDGDTLVASRFVYDPNNPRADAASLYYASGNDYVADPASPRDYQMIHVDRRSTLAIISSEPLTECRCDWVQVPKNHIVVITATIDIMLFPVCQDSDRISRTLSNLGEDFRSSPKLALQATDAVDLALHFQERFNCRPVHAGRGDLLTPYPCPPSGTTAHLRRPGHTPELTLPSSFSIRANSGVSTPRTMSPGPTGPTLRYTIQVKDAAVLSTVVSGVYLCSGTQDGQIRVWHIRDRVEATVLKYHTSAILALEADEPSSVLISGSSDSTICLWKMSAPSLFQCLCVVACNAHGDVFSLAVVDRFVYAGFSDTKLRRMTENLDSIVARSDAQHNEVGTKELESLTGLISSTWALQPSGAGPLKQYLRGEKQCAHYGYIFALAACRNGAHICSGSGDGLVRVWDTTSQNLVRELVGHRGAVLALAVINDTGESSLLFSGSRDGTVKVWDIDSQYLCKRTLRKHKDEVVSCAASGNVVISGSADGQVYLWCARTLHCIAHYRASSLHTAALSYPLQLVFIASDAVIQVRDLVRLNMFGEDTKLYPKTQSLRAMDRPRDSCLQEVACFGASDAFAPAERHSTTAAITGSAERKESSGKAMEPVQSVDDIGNVKNGIISKLSDDGDDGNEPDDGFDRSTVLVPGVPNELVLAPSWDRARNLPDRSLAAGVCTLDGLAKLPTPGGDGHASQASTRSPQMAAALVSSRLTEERLMQDVLEQFVSFATVSGDEGHRESCWQGAKYLATFLEGLGAAVNMVAPPPSSAAAQVVAGVKTSTSTVPFELTRRHSISSSQAHNPILFARFPSVRDKAPTLVFYAHYDVMPANAAEWASDPWSLRALDGHLYGRGVTDNKGPIVAMIFAIKSLLEAAEEKKQGLSINIVLVLQGEGEQKSVGFQEAIEANRHWFDRTVLILTSNSSWLGEDRPCLTYSTRGVIDLNVSVSGPAHNLHTGVDGGALYEPVSDLMAVLGTLYDGSGGGSGRVLVPGFYDDVKGLSAEDRARLDEVPFALEDYALRTGVGRFKASDPASLLELRWRQPSVSVASLDTSNKARLHSVIPFEASAKLSVRFVPHQDPHKLVSLIRAHLSGALLQLHQQQQQQQQVEGRSPSRGSPNRLTVECVGMGDWWLGDPSCAEFCLAARALEAVWGCSPLYVCEGGTMPIFSFLSRSLGAPIVQVPLGQASDGAHLPNERMRALNLFRGKKVLQHIVRELNEQHCHEAV